MTNPFSKLADIIKEDHAKIRSHSVKELEETLTNEEVLQYFPHLKTLSNKMTDEELGSLLEMVANIIYQTCDKVYHNQI